MGNVHTVGPNEALVVSGGCLTPERKKTIVGGWAFAWTCVTNVKKISLEAMTLNPRCENAETAKGVAVTVTGVAQVKVIKEQGLLKVACEQFLGKSTLEIKNMLLQTFEGHLRAILGTLTVEEIYKDRDTFASMVREVASPDVGRMGIEILSFTIKDIYDKVHYLDSLGKTQTANVKRDAAIGVAEAKRDAGIREAECEKGHMEVKHHADTNIANHYRDFQVRKAEFDREVNAKKAEAELHTNYRGQKKSKKSEERKFKLRLLREEKPLKKKSKRFGGWRRN